MSHRYNFEAPITSGQINQAVNNDIRGLLNRKALTPERAHRLRVALIRGDDWSKKQALKEVAGLLVSSPSHMRGIRPRRSYRRPPYGHDDLYPSRNGYGSNGRSTSSSYV